MKKLNIVLVLVLAYLLTPAAYAALSKDLNASESKIPWKDWAPEAFEQALKEDKMILVNVGIEVCFACQWMEEGTYQIPEVYKVVNEHFVTIQVDANARPDLGERYSDWAWPATIFMKPDGTQVLALRGNYRPRNFMPVLNKLIEQKANNALEEDELSPYAAAPEPETTELTKIRDKIRAHLDKDFDDNLGGWGDELKEIDDVGRIEQLMFRSYVESDAVSQQRLLKTAYGMTQRQDSVWGGFYAAGFDGWGKPIPEKRTGAQASALLTYAWAYKMTADDVFLKAAAEVDRYMNNWMRNEQGLFYTSQESQPKRLPRGMNPLDYFSLDDAKRRELGIPPVDHSIYTDLNARLISAYVNLYEVSNNKKYLDTAVTIATQLIKQRQHPEGWMVLVTQDDKLSGDERIHKLSIEQKPYLRAQGQFGNALLALLRATGQVKWRTHALQIAQSMQAKLEDKKLGGFYGAPLEKGTLKAAPPRKPLEDNGVAARFFYQLGVYVKNDDYKQAAEQALRAVSVPSMLRREGRIVGNLAVAFEILTSGYVEFSVVANGYSDQAKALFDASRVVPEPRKVLHYELPGRYPDLGKPALYMCSERACSVPIFSAEKVDKEAAKFKHALSVNAAQNLSTRQTEKR